MTTNTSHFRRLQQWLIPLPYVAATWIFAFRPEKDFLRFWKPVTWQLSTWRFFRFAEGPSHPLGRLPATQVLRLCRLVDLFVWSASRARPGALAHRPENISGRIWHRPWRRGPPALDKPPLRWLSWRFSRRRPSMAAKFIDPLKKPRVKRYLTKVHRRHRPLLYWFFFLTTMIIQPYCKKHISAQSIESISLLLFLNVREVVVRVEQANSQIWPWQLIKMGQKISFENTGWQVALDLMVFGLPYLKHFEGKRQLWNTSWATRSFSAQSPMRPSKSLSLLPRKVAKVNHQALTDMVKVGGETWWDYLKLMTYDQTVTSHSVHFHGEKTQKLVVFSCNMVGSITNKPPTWRGRWRWFVIQHVTHSWGESVTSWWFYYVHFLRATWNFMLFPKPWILLIFL